MKKGTKALIVIVVVVVVLAAGALILLPRLLPDNPLVSRFLPQGGPGQKYAASGGRAAVTGRGGADPAEKFSVPVVVYSASSGPARETLLLYGSVFAHREVGIFSLVAGKIKELRVQAGDRVTRDQVLAVIDRDQAGLKFANAEVTSTIDGVVKSVLTEVGATVSPAAPLFQVVDVQTLEVAVNVPEKRLGRVREGLPAEISVLAYPNRVFYGKVSRLNPALDPVSRTLEARIRVDNPGQALKPGMFAEVRLLLRQEQQIVRVPLAVLVDKNGGQVAFVVHENRAREVAVKTAFVQEDTAAVDSGITAGDRVVVVGQQNLNDGDEVTVVEEKK
jgi:multidrug efflux pump subunit AcrA (membrane-fusion protein)